MNSSKYVGMDVHTATISVAVRNASGKLIMESVLETKASTLLQFIRGLGGDVYVTFEEGTWAAWLYDLLSEWQACHKLSNEKNLIMRRRWKNLKIQGCQEAICFALSGMWCAIRATRPCSRKAARATGSMRLSCPSCCAPISSVPSITEKRGCAR